METELKDDLTDEASCSSRFNRVIRIVRICARLCGVDVTVPGYRMNWVSYLMLALVFVFYCTAIYTVYAHIHYYGNFAIFLQATCFLSTGIQSNVKFAFYIVQRSMVREAQTYLENTYEKYEKKGSNYRKVLFESVVNIIRGMKLFAFIYITFAVACTGFPLIYNAINNDNMLIMVFLLPGLDPSTNTGFYLLTVFHICCLAMGAFGNFASDMYLLTFIGSVPLLKNILRCKFEDLDVMMSQEIQPSKKQLRAVMVDIVICHSEYLRLLYCTEQTYYIIIFAHVFCSAASIVSTTYCMLMGIWLAAPFFLLLSLANLYLYCGLGTVIDNANEDCTSIIYTGSSWYDLPISEQRFVLLMLLKSQATEGLTVGNMMPLTVETALNLTKAVYSMSMLLMRNRD